MLSSAEKQQLALAIIATAETLGQTMSANAARMMADDLAGYTQDAIANALKACRKELTGRMALAHILERIERADGRPTSDEAWPIALRAMDEDETVLMTPEIVQALAEARPVLAIGDKIAGRKTFQAAYDRALLKARSEAQPVVWEVSLGRNPELRRQALEDAERKGLLPAPEVRARLELVAPDAALSADGQAIAGLLTSDQDNAPIATSPEVRSRLNELRHAVICAKQVKRANEAELRQREREELARRKARHAELLAQRGGDA